MRIVILLQPCQKLIGWNQLKPGMRSRSIGPWSNIAWMPRRLASWAGWS